MFRNYLITTIRHIRRHSTHTIINLLGLSIALGACMLIATYVIHELSFERHHKKRDRIVQILKEYKTEGGQVERTSGPLGRAIAETFPEVENFLRTRTRRFWTRIDDRGKYCTLRLADASIFDIFTIPIVQGDTKRLRAEPFTVAITESTAKALGIMNNPIGHTITTEPDILGKTLEVVAVIRDMPRTSLHVQFDMLLTTATPYYRKAIEEQWRIKPGYYPFVNYLYLREGTDRQALTEKINAEIPRWYGDDAVGKFELHLQPIEDLRLYGSHRFSNSGSPGTLKNVQTLGGIGVLILLIAIINYVNLATARATDRAKEVGIRKVVGAQRMQLVAQFIGESIAFTYIAAIMGLWIAQACISEFGILLNQPLNTNALTSVFGIGALLVSTTAIGLLSGIYPALVLTGFDPVESIKGRTSKGRTRSGTRKALVGFQFAMTLVLLVSTITVYRQWAFMSNKALGYSIDQVIRLPVFARDRSLQGDPERVKNTFLRHPNVLAATASNDTPTGGGMVFSVRAEGQAQPWSMRMLMIDYDFIDLFEIEITQGRNISRNISTDYNEAFLINETAVKALGWDNPIGKEFELLEGYMRKKGRVIGVVKDFHLRPLQEPMQPLFMCAQYNRQTLMLKIKSGDWENTLAHLETAWRQFHPNKPLEFKFMDEKRQRWYEQERKFGTLCGVFALLAIVVAMLGVFGLVSYAIARRTREIGIRKALGANYRNIVALFLLDLLIPILTATAIASPVAWFASITWLNDFAHRVNVNIPILMACIGLTALLCAFIVITQTLRPASANPCDALRQE